MASEAGADSGRAGRRSGAVAVGLTGGIGAGKSTALAMFQQLGARTISADRIVHDLYARPEVSSAVVERFGPEVLQADGSVDRRKLGELVRGKREELRWLEELTHPAVADEIARFVAHAPRGTVVVCEVPLLFEARYEAMFDLIVTIEAGQEHRLRRAAHRTHHESFRDFDRLQAGTERRMKGSHMAFCNDGDLDALRQFVGEAYTRASAIAADLDR